MEDKDTENHGCRQHQVDSSQANSFSPCAPGHHTSNEQNVRAVTWEAKVRLKSPEVFFYI